MDTSDAFLTGAILVVSGPTVVGPLVRVMRPRAPIGPVLNWESTVLDPLGAVLGVVVLNIVVASARGELHPALQLGERLGVGVAIGAVAAALLVLVLARFLVTDDMEAAVALMFAVAAYAVAEVLVSEAGLLAAVVLGVVVANQRRVPTARISGFGETLEVLIIGILFMVLGALVPLDDLLDNLGRIAALVAVLVLVVRPLGVSLALARTGVSRNERVLIGGVDPRGIVAAATAAQFSGVLDDDGLSNRLLLPVVFGVILGAGVVYGIGAPLLARLLGVVAPRPTGVCLIGDAPWVRDLARQLHGLGLPVLRLTTGPPGDALETARTEQIATISVHDSLERVEHALADAPLAVAIVAAPPVGAVALLEARLLEDLGRRHVARPGADGVRPRLLIRADGSVHLVARRDRRTAHGDTVVASSL
jgi:NhaP-type Na+/H+ or K+/H+ antiporter